MANLRVRPALELSQPTHVGFRQADCLDYLWGIDLLAAGPDVERHDVNRPVRGYAGAAVVGVAFGLAPGVAPTAGGIAGRAKVTTWKTTRVARTNTTSDMRPSMTYSPDCRSMTQQTGRMIGRKSWECADVRVAFSDVGMARTGIGKYRGSDQTTSGRSLSRGDANAPPKRGRGWVSQGGSGPRICWLTIPAGRAGRCR